MYEGETVEGRVTVAARGISHTYTKLAELAFDSYRKCMSVIVKVTFTALSSTVMVSSQDLDEKIHVLSKGAESTMLAACVSGDLASTEQHITSLASLGTGVSRHVPVTVSYVQV